MLKHTFAGLSKKNTNLTITFDYGGVMVIITSSRFRHKVLRHIKTLCATVTYMTKGITIQDVFDVILQWWEELDVEELFRRMENAPQGHKPIIRYDEKLLLDFNTPVENMFAVSRENFDERIMVL